MRKHLVITAAAGAAALLSGALAVGVARAGDDDSIGDRVRGFRQTNLVSSIPGLAQTTDPNLKNPWGMAFAPGGALWVSDNATGKATLYNGDGTIVPLVVTVPGAPTGIVWNPNPSQFVFRNGMAQGGAIFIFASEDGTISAWNPTVSGLTTAVVVHNSGPSAVYKGLAFGTNSTGNFIFATNFSQGTIEAYDTSFNQVRLRGSFRDPYLPSGFGPFGIENINGDLFVTFAKQDPQRHDDVPGPGLGVVDVFDTNGNLIRRLVSNGPYSPLNAPWGLAIAPQGFADLGGDILVGNFGDGRINVFDNSGSFIGTLRSPNGRPIAIDGLWGLKFGGFAKADPNDLYFTSGPMDETQGLLGEISAIGRSR